MWEDDYIGSLTLLPGALAELGATAKLENVSLEEEEVQWELTSLESIINYTRSKIDSLEDHGFFLFLNHLSEIAREMKSALAAAPAWKVAKVVDRVEQTLRPMHGALSRFAPNKVYGTLLEIKNFLEEAGAYDWEGEYRLEHLTALHEHLEELRPQSRLDGLKDLCGLLVAQGQELEWLASHPFVEKKLGRQNVFGRLIFIKVHLRVTLVVENCLENMDGMLEELDHLQTIDLQD